MNKCKYQIKYFDYDFGEPKLFECSEEALNSDLCIFHDEKYENKDKLLERLSEKLDSIDGKTPIFFIGYNIPTITLSKSFSKPVYFTRATIQDGNFSKISFQNADFSGSKIQKANFSGTQFENVDFLAAEFTKFADFSKTNFKKKVNFSDSVFNEANFSESTISKGQFLGTKFKTADFSLSKIEDSDFFGVTFEEEITFVGANISRTRFPNSEFKGPVRFTGATLTKTNFPQSKFNSVDFDNVSINVSILQGTTFFRDVNFSNSNLEKIDFFNSNFKKNVNFTDTTIKEISFTETIFEGLIKFVRTKFQDQVKFFNVEFNNVNFIDSIFEGKTFFHDVLFRIPEKVVFYVDELSKVSFKNTDLKKIRFGEKIKWAGKDGFKIIDEEYLNEFSDLKELESVIATYRNLRKNYESRCRDEEAKKFHANEIELKKRYLKNQSPMEVSDLEIIESKLEDLTKNLEELKIKVSKLEEFVKNIKGLETKNPE